MFCADPKSDLEMCLPAGLPSRTRARSVCVQAECTSSVASTTTSSTDSSQKHSKAAGLAIAD